MLPILYGQFMAKSQLPPNSICCLTKTCTLLSLKIQNFEELPRASYVYQSNESLFDISLQCGNTNHRLSSPRPIIDSLRCHEPAYVESGGQSVSEKFKRLRIQKKKKKDSQISSFIIDDHLKRRRIV